MQTSKKGLAEIISYEGVSTKPYKDSVGVWTMGIGRTKSDGIKINANTPPISIQQAFDWFKSDIKPYEDAVNKALRVPISQEQFDALVSFQYNTGSISEATFMKRINNKESMKRITDTFMWWDKPKEIIGRRTKEMKLFRDGKYSNNGKCDLITVDYKFHPHYSSQIAIEPYL